MPPQRKQSGDPNLARLALSLSDRIKFKKAEDESTFGPATKDRIALKMGKDLTFTVQDAIRVLRGETVLP